MLSALLNPISIKEGEITVFSETPKFPIGQIYEFSQEHPEPSEKGIGIQKYIYLRNGSDILQFEPAIVYNTGEPGESVVALHSIKPTAPRKSGVHLTCIPQIEIPGFNYGFWLIEGYGKAKVEATVPVVALDFMEVKASNKKIFTTPASPFIIDEFSRAVAYKTITVTGTNDIYLMNRFAGVPV